MKEAEGWRDTVSGMIKKRWMQRANLVAVWSGSPLGCCWLSRWLWLVGSRDALVFSRGPLEISFTQLPGKFKSVTHFSLAHSCCRAEKRMSPNVGLARGTGEPPASSSLFLNSQLFLCTSSGVWGAGEGTGSFRMPQKLLAAAGLSWTALV